MSYQSLIDRLSAEHLDVRLAQLGILVSIALLSLRLLAEQALLVAIPLAMGAACVFYVATQSRRVGGRAERVENVAVPTLPRTVLGYLPAVVFAGLAGLVLLIRASGGRTIPAYLLIGAIGSAILAQILLVEDEHFAPAPVLAQIIVAAVVIRLSALFATPGFVGVDIWTHVPVFIEGIVEEQSLAAIADRKYVMAPIYHLVGAVAALVFGSARVGTYLSLGILIPLSALFVYATGKLFLPARWALAATALYAFTDQFIRWGMHIIPTSLGLVFFLGLLYLVTKLFYTNAEGWVVLFLAVFSLAIVFTHQVSTAVMLVFLATASFVAISVKAIGGPAAPVGATRNAVALVGVFALNVLATIWSWLNTPYTGEEPFLVNRIANLQRALADVGFLQLAGDSGNGDGTAAAAESQTLLATLVPYIEVFGLALLLLITILGGLVMLKWDRPTGATFTILLTAGGLFVFVYGLSLFGFRALLPGRWTAFLYAPMAVIGATGLYYLSQHASKRMMLAVFVILALGFPMTMVVAEQASMDSPVFEEEHLQFAYTESEIAGADTITEIQQPTQEDVIHSDHPYWTLYDRPDRYDGRVLIMDEGQADVDTPIVYREYQSHKQLGYHNPGPYPRTSFRASFAPSSICSPDRDRVYSNDQVRLCTPSEAAPEVEG